MNLIVRILLLLTFLQVHVDSPGQSEQRKKVVITGVRFAYPILEKWIDEYKEANPSVDIQIAPRTNVDPSQHDLLIEAYIKDESMKDDREYLYLGRYAVVPVANASSDFAGLYGEKGLTRDQIEQIFFHNIFDAKESEIKAPFTIYTRLQKAGAPTTFAKYFGFDQQQINGKAISGSDEHLIKALLKDSTGISYNNLGLIYDLEKRTVLPGLKVLPVDTDDNGRVSKEEKIYDNLDEVLSHLEQENIKNIPLEYFHLSIPKHGYNPEALKFLLWVIHNSQDDLHTFGYLKPEQKRFEREKEKFEQLASR